MNTNEAIPGMVPTANGTHAVMIDPKNGHYGWMFFKHPDGMWVSSRKATEDEFKAAERQALRPTELDPNELIARWAVAPKSRQEKIKHLALTNPIVKGCLDMQREPGVLYEDALEMMVITLAKHNEQALSELLAIKQRGLPPTVFVVSQEQADKIHTAYSGIKP